MSPRHAALPFHSSHADAVPPERVALAKGERQLGIVPADEGGVRRFNLQHILAALDKVRLDFFSQLRTAELHVGARHGPGGKGLEQAGAKKGRASEGLWAALK